MPEYKHLTAEPALCRTGNRCSKLWERAKIDLA